MSNDQNTESEETLAERVLRLRREIEYHTHRYYVLDDPQISDAAFDSLMRELRDIEDAHPALRDPSSPTQRVGGEVGNQFSPVVHEQRMYSLDNSMDLNELDAWMDRTEEALGKFVPLVCELKIDGSSLALTFEDGRLVRAATRGDGTTGEDVTVNVRTVHDIPLRLMDEGAEAVVEGIPSIEVRGEIYMSKASFEALNEQAEALGNRTFTKAANWDGEHASYVRDKESLKMLRKIRSYSSVFRVTTTSFEKYAADACVDQKMTPKQAMESIINSAQAEINERFGV